MSFKNINREEVVDGSRIGGLLGMLGCYVLILAEVIVMGELSTVVGYLILSSATFAIVGALISFFIEASKAPSHQV